MTQDDIVYEIESLKSMKEENRSSLIVLISDYSDAEETLNNLKSEIDMIRDSLDNFDDLIMDLESELI